MPLFLLVSTRGHATDEALRVSPAFVLLRGADEVGRGTRLDLAVYFWGLIGAFGVILSLGAAWGGLREVLAVPAAPRGDGH